MNVHGESTGGVPASEPVTLGPSAGDLVWFLVLALLGCVTLGLALPPVAGWVAVRSGAPLQRPLESIAALGVVRGLALGLVLGLVLGLGLAARALHAALRVRVGADAVTLRQGRTSRRVARPEVGAVFLDGPRLVLIDTGAREIMRDEVDAKHRRIEQAFRVHDYPWRAEDPYAPEFRPWRSETPDLPGPINTIFASRDASLREDEPENAAELRAELVRRGYVVRDEGARQYWRAVP